MKNRNIILGASTALLIIGGIIWYRSRKPKEEEITPAPTLEPEPEVKPTTTTGQDLPSTPFKNETEGNAFRAWMNKNHPDFRYSGDKLSPVGKYDNSFMRVAYQKYGAEYEKSKSVSTTTTYDIQKVKANLGSGAVKEFTDHIQATVKVDNKIYTGSFYKSGRYYLTGEDIEAGKQKTGNWSDGGKKIVMSNGRILSTGSVWSNIKESVKA